MTDNLDDVIISEEERNKHHLKIYGNRPNTFDSYRKAKLSADETKQLFDDQFDLVVDRHNALARKTKEAFDGINDNNALAEQERVQAEISRQAEERARGIAEEERSQAEAYRQVNETERCDTEQERQNNEDERIANEKNRMAMGRPIGSIYMSVDSTSPAKLFGGSWERLKDRFLLGAGDNYSAGSTGGSATHTLTESEMPRHTHRIYSQSRAYVGIDWKEPGDGTGKQSLNIATAWKWPTDPTDGIQYGQLIAYAQGNNASHNNMPPYLTVYMWKRIA